jgi:hypothetical protein
VEVSHLRGVFNLVETVKDLRISEKRDFSISPPVYSFRWIHATPASELTCNYSRAN